MSGTTPQELVTLSRDTIHNPNEPRHYMRIKPVGRRVRVLRDGKVLADSTDALRVLEAGRDIYDPVIYVPRDDVCAELASAEKDKTFCPIKGHASYFDLLLDDGRIDVAEIAWSYEDTVTEASQLKDRIAFVPATVLIEEHPST